MSALPESASVAQLLAAPPAPLRREAEMLLAHVMAVPRTTLLAKGEKQPSPEQRARFDALLARRAAGEPMAYLTGTREFWSLPKPLTVTPAVLIPRPETELLVEWAVQRCDARGEWAVADLGTGSGAIALALRLERHEARVTATDISPEALAVAQANAKDCGAGSIDFLQGSWWVPLKGKRFDLIVSNPPYIAEGDPHLPALRFEPQAALVSGRDGLDALRVIVSGAAAHLKPGGFLMVEHGTTQGQAVRALFTAAGFRDIESRRDYAGHERVTGGQRT